MICRTLQAGVLVLALGMVAGCGDGKKKPEIAKGPVSGKQVYENHCAACHGANGDGNGPASVWLFPKPRNFSSGLFKVKSTPADSLPSDADLFHTVTKGMPGSAMPSFVFLSEAERKAAVEYVKGLSGPDDGTGKRASVFEQAKAAGKVAKPIEVPLEPPPTIETVIHGKKLFQDMKCASCHGETGAGDGPSAATLKDNWGYPLRPRDFNIGSFRGGSDGKDLYLRIATGMPGTPMAAFGDEVLTPEQRWALVQYIQSLRRKDVAVNDMLTPEDGTIPVLRVDSLPAGPIDPAWEPIETKRVPLNPLWPTFDHISSVAVRALHDGKRLAVLLQWRDSVENGAPIRVQDFQDAAALQFSLNGTTPFLGMGDSKNPVNIWQWKAGWQQEADGRSEDMVDAYPSMHVDLYPEKRELFITAEAAGNLLSQPKHFSSVEESNARGFGTLKSQPADSQDVVGRGVWRDGHWNVMMVRKLKRSGDDDVVFRMGETVPVAFGIWDGQTRDRNGKKVFSNWYQLALAP